MVSTKRIEALDVLRGATVAAMIMVNNGGRGSFEALRHATWNGLTLCDFVFPFFLFIVGFSVYAAFSRGDFEFTSSKFAKIVKRTVLLLFIGLALNWLEKVIGGAGWLCFDTLRYWAVLQRIALCYFIVSILALSPLRPYMGVMAVFVLLVYGLILILGDGYSTDRSVNILSRVDESLFGYAHLYHKSAVDPEGLTGTLGAVANSMFGFWCAGMVWRHSDYRAKINSVFIAAGVLLIAGFILSFLFPYNKRIWSPSFALTTSGTCALLLGMLMYLISDGRNGVAKKHAVEWFKVFGCNALFLYVFSEVIAVVAGRIGLSGWWYSLLSGFISPEPLASLIYALSYVAICWLAGFALWRRQIFIKI